MKRLQASLYCRVQDPTLSTVSNAPVAQWIEHLTTDQKVTGSSPVGRTKRILLRFLCLADGSESVTCSPVGRTIPSLLDPEPTKIEATG